MLTKFYRSKLVLVIEVLALTIFPLILLKNFPEWLIYRHWVMLGGLVYVFLFVWSQRPGWKNLGFQSANFIQAVAVLIRPTLLAILCLIILYKLLPTSYVLPLGIAGVKISPIIISVFRYIFISAPLQEILYRSYLINRAGLVIKNQLFIRAYATMIFILIHTPFKTPVLTLGSLILGWIWTGHFLKFRNIYSLIFSHILIGATYIILMGLS